MSTLKRIDQLLFEKLLGMSTGYVYGFSDRTFGDFVLESTGIDVYAPGYEKGGTSKANRLRTFWSTESDTLTSRLLNDLIAFWRRQRLLAGEQITDDEETLVKECNLIIQRLSFAGEVQDVDAFRPDTGDQQFSDLAASIRLSIDQGVPNQALDRLHTFVTRKLRQLCEKHSIDYHRDLQLSKLFSRYGDYVEARGFLESEMAKRIFKTSGSLLDAFDNVRNTQSFAHDNPILSKRESVLIFNSLSNVLRFIESIEIEIDTSRSDPPHEEVDWKDLEFDPLDLGEPELIQIQGDTSPKM